MQATNAQRYPGIRNYSLLRNLTEADLIFRADAEQLGYLHRPRGMARYYRAYGILPPRYLDEELRKFEFTHFDFDLIAATT